MKKLLFLGLCLALLGGACANDGASELRAFEDSQGCTDEKALETLDVTVVGPTSPLARGSIAEFDVHVVRAVELDEKMAQDLPRAAVDDPSATAVEGALVGLSLSVPNAAPMGGMAVTDDHGIATVAIRVKRSTPAGTADGTGFAWREVFEGPCVRVAETGSYHQEAAATIK